MRSTLSAGVAVLAVLAVAAPASAAYDPLSSAEIVKRFNEFRAQHGLPANVVEDTEWSSRCTQHNSYMERNGTLAHEEDPAKPGYSEAGNWAGTHSVLAQGPTWRDGHPWQNAPIHLNQTLAPELAKAGASEQHDHNCLTTFAGYGPRGGTGRVFTYPGNGQSMPYQQDVFESPPEPQEWAGLGREDVTGPFLIGYHDSLEETVLTSGSITGPDGAVDSRVLNPGSHPQAYLAPNSGFLFAVKPLKPGATYTATMNFTPGQNSSASAGTTHSFTLVANEKKLCGNGTGGWDCGSAGPSGPSGPTGPGGTPGVTVAKSHSYRKIKKKGLPVTVQVTEAGSVVEAYLTKGKKRVAKPFAATASSAGPLTLRFKIAKATAAALLKKGSAKLTVQVIVRPPAGDPTVASKTTKLTK